MSEKLVLKPVLNGVELVEIDMGESHLDTIYKEELVFYRSGHIYVKGRAIYAYNIRISRSIRDSEVEAIGGEHVEIKQSNFPF